MRVVGVGVSGVYVVVDDDGVIVYVVDGDVDVVFCC